MLLPRKKTTVAVFDDDAARYARDHDVWRMDFSDDIIDNFSMVDHAVCSLGLSDHQLDLLARISRLHLLLKDENGAIKMHDRGWRLNGGHREYLSLSNFGKLFYPEDIRAYRRINYSKHDFQFTEKWFEYTGQATYSLMMRRFIGQPIRVLQVGVFEGLDLVWMLQNVLFHPDSRVVGVDLWGNFHGYKGEDVQRRARHNLSPWADKVRLIQGDSRQVLKNDLGEPFDLIIIDGDHSTETVAEDAENALLLAKPGCRIVFDDVEYKPRSPLERRGGGYQTTARKGVIQWLKKHGDRVKFAWRHRHMESYETIG